MKLNKSILILITFIMSSIFTGCWDKIELEEIGYVAAIGIDKGSGKNLRVTFQITNPKTIGGGRSGGGQGEKRSEIISLDSPGLLTARDLASASTTRRISLSHSKVIIVGEGLAASEDFFRLIETALRDKEMRRIMTVLVSRESAENFIRANNPILEDRMQKFYEFMSRRWKDTGFVPPFSNLNRFMQRTENGQSLFLATYASAKEYPEKKGVDEGEYVAGEINKSGGNPAEMIGAAVFKNGRMIGTLTGNEVRLVSMLREQPEVKSMLVTLPDPLDKEYRIGLRINRDKNTKINVDVDGESPKIYINVPLSVDILGIESFINYPEDMDKQKFLKKFFESYLEKGR